LLPANIFDMAKQKDSKGDEGESVELVKCRVLKREISLTSDVGSIALLEQSRFEVLEAWGFVEKVEGNDK